MKIQENISVPKKNKKPFIQKGKKETFIKSPEKLSRATHQENNANQFAKKVITNTAVVQAFLQSKTGTHVVIKEEKPESKTLISTSLSQPLIHAFKTHFDLDFSDIRIYNDEYSRKITTQFNAAAITIDNHIFLNPNAYEVGSLDGLRLLAHELFHTIQQNESSEKTEFQLKPLSELNDRSADQSAALLRAVKIAEGEQGKVNSSALNEDKTRIGWEFLLEYFKTTLGEDTIVHDRSEYKQGKFLEENIKYVRYGRAQKVIKVGNEFKTEIDEHADLLPSWCGIFAFWALHKGGVHPPNWIVGQPNFTSADTYKKGEYLPRAGDIVIKNGYNHHALVVRTEPEIITDTKDLNKVQVITINGNTAGSNHQGGQIQEKSDPYSYWDFYVNPFFKGVRLTDAKDYKADDRLKPSLGEKTEKQKEEQVTLNAKLKVNQYNNTLQPVSNFLSATPTEKKKEEPEIVEEAKSAKINTKEIMANDAEYNQLNSTLNKNSKDEKVHDTPEKKVKEAQQSAVSPGNERSSKAQAIKVEKLGAIQKPKEFKAEEIKQNILKAVEDLLKEKAEQVNGDKDRAKIKQTEVDKLKKDNNEDISKKKKDSIGPVEETHKEAPDESKVDARTNIDVIVEDAGADKKIPGTDKAVAKPINDERITLQSESDNIDKKMADKDVDEQQLAESNEEKFTSSLDQKRKSQAEAANVKEDYREIETAKLEKDKKIAKAGIADKVDKIHDARKSEFANVNNDKQSTKTADEVKRKEISDNIEKIYTDSEKSVTGKLAVLDESVNTKFDGIMTKATENFQKNVNTGLDNEFTWEFGAKLIDKDDYDSRVKGVFNRESEKYKKELADGLTPLTTEIADTLNAIVNEIAAAKTAVVVYVNGLDPSLAEIGTIAAQGVLEKFASLEESVNEKQDALTNGLAKKYADGVIGLEEEFKKIMDSRKSWLEKALDAIVDAIKEIIQLLADLKKALERAAEYGKRIIKAPIKFLNNLVKGATAGFNNFVKNIGKHLLQGALEWVTGEMGDAGIQLPAQFDFKGILSIILQILGISVANVKEIAKKVIGEKYVNMLEKGVDFGMKVGDKIFKIFTIIKNEGIAGLWEFIKEQFNDLKEKLMEEAKSFIVVTIVEVAVTKVVSMLIPGAGFISAIKSLIDFLRTLFAKARQIVNIITGIIDTFGEILEGNVAKVSAMVEGVLAKFLGMAITFLAAILGLGKIGKQINEIIQKKIKEPIKKAITKMMEKLKALMTKLGIFKLMDKVDEKIKKGKDWVDDKKEKLKDKAKQGWDKFKKWLSYKKQFKTKSGETHSLYFDKATNPNLTIASTPMTFAAFINSINTNNEKDKENAKKSAIEIAKKIDARKNENIKNANPTEDEVKQFEETKSNALKDLFGELATHASLLFETFALPDTKVNFGAQDSASEFATSMNALYLNKKFQKNGSAPTSKNTNVYQFLNLRKNGGSTYYIKGHLLNQKMGGKGDWDNLTPLSRSGNSQHEGNVESVGKQFLDSSAIISYDVVVVYSFGQRKKEGDTVLAKLKSLGDPEYDTKAKIIEAENYVPVGLKCSATLMNKVGDDFVKGPVVFDSKMIQNVIARGEKDYDINGEKKIIVYLDADKLEDNLKNANFDKTLIDKILNAKSKDPDIKRYDKLFSLGKIDDAKERDQIKDQVVLFHKTA